MQWSVGLKRLWLFVTVLGCLAACLNALDRSDLNGEGQPSSQCIPGTIGQDADDVPVGKRTPSPAELKESIRKNPENWSEQPDGTFIPLVDPYVVMGKRNFFYCTTYWSVVRQVLVAALLSLALGAFFASLGWVLKGFRKPS